MSGLRRGGGRVGGVGTGTFLFDYGIDVSLRAIGREGSRHWDAGTQIDVQMKSTGNAHVSESEVRYDVEVRAYDFLRIKATVPRILVLLVLPDEEERWFGQSVEELVLRHCAYWFSLREMAPTTASSSVRIAIPRTQVFSPTAIHAMMERVSQRGQP